MEQKTVSIIIFTNGKLFVKIRSEETENTVSEILHTELPNVDQELPTTSLLMMLESFIRSHCISLLVK